MTETYCEYARRLIGDDLSRTGFSFVGERRFPNYDRPPFEVCLFEGHGRSIAIEMSVTEGVACFVGKANADPSQYREWPSLWALLDLEPKELTLDSIGDYLDEFPEHTDDMLRFTANKLRALVERS